MGVICIKPYRIKAGTARKERMGHHCNGVLSGAHEIKKANKTNKYAASPASADQGLIVGDFLIYY